MAWKPITFYSPGTVLISSGNSGGWNSIKTGTGITVDIQISTGVSITALDMWLVGTNDGGVTEFPLYAVRAAKDSATGTEVACRTNVRDIVDAKSTTTTEVFYAEYDNVNASHVRLKHILSGTSVTLGARASVK